MTLAADLDLWPSDRLFRFSGERCVSILIFFEWQGEVISTAARIDTVDRLPLAPGTNHRGAKMTFSTGYLPSALLERGVHFVLWYQSEVGSGTFTSCINTERA